MIIKAFNIQRLLIFFLVMLVAGCTSTYAPVEQRGSASSYTTKKFSGKIPNYYTVKKGDTLYSIAWLYGFDYKAIAKNNNIRAPYRIYAGQKLTLKPIPAKKKIAYKSSKKKITAKNTNKKITKAKAKAKIKSSQKKYANKAGTKIVITPKSATKKYSKLNWSWPVKGKIIQKYSPSRGKKGIDISAAHGVIVKSSEAGKVVYSGQGLVGYGRMIIIKHNETFLSAYAHNQSLLVNEGQFVKKGQTIARLGRSGTDRFKLHFEIRKNGKPVNPLTYLPH